MNYDEEKLSRDTKISVKIVKKTMVLFEQTVLIKSVGGGKIIPYIREIIDSEGSSAERVRTYRNKKQEEKTALQCNKKVTQI